MHHKDVIAVNLTLSAESGLESSQKVGEGRDLSASSRGQSSRGERLINTWSRPGLRPSAFRAFFSLLLLFSFFSRLNRVSYITYENTVTLVPCITQILDSFTSIL